MSALSQDWRHYARDLRRAERHLKAALRQLEILREHGEQDRVRVVLIDAEVQAAARATEHAMLRFEQAPDCLSVLSAALEVGE